MSRESISEQFALLGVEENTIEALTTKVLNGEPLDSMKEEYSNILPVESGWTSNNEYIEKYVYPDGSIKQVQISRGVFNGNISGGSYSAGTYYYTWTNAKVSATWGIVTASFRADFQGANGLGKITSVYDYGISVIGGTFSSQSLTINRANATSSNPAQATLFFIGTATGDFGQSTFYLRLYVPYTSGAYARLTVN